MAPLSSCANDTGDSEYASETLSTWLQSASKLLSSPSIPCTNVSSSSLTMLSSLSLPPLVVEATVFADTVCEGVCAAAARTAKTSKARMRCVCMHMRISSPRLSASSL